MPRILGCGPREFIGACRVLRELSHLGLADFVYLKELKPPVKDYDVVIFAAYHPSYNILFPKIEARKWVLWTSPLLQAELAEVEVEYLQYVLRNDNVERVWLGSRGVYEALKDVSDKMVYCPYPLDARRVLAHKAEVEKENAIGMFLPFHNKQKNVYGQLAACKILQREHQLKLYTNGMLSHQRRFANSLGLSYKDLGFLPEDEYYRWIQKFKLMLHVSLSESLAFAVMDALLLSWTPFSWEPRVSFLQP